jgi:hypothetical protein
VRNVTAGLFSLMDGVVMPRTSGNPHSTTRWAPALSRMLEDQDAVLLGQVTFGKWAQSCPTSTVLNAPDRSRSSSVPGAGEIAVASQIAANATAGSGNRPCVTSSHSRRPAERADRCPEASSTAWRIGADELRQALVLRRVIDVLETDGTRRVPK